MSAAAESPLAPPGRRHLQPVPTGDIESHREEREPMPTPAAALPDPAKALLATRIQGLFLKAGLSLVEPGTAEVYRATLAAARLIIGSALANDVLTPESHGILADMVDAAEVAPDIL